MKVELISITPNAERLIALAYGICTKKSVPLANIQSLVAKGHESPLEHSKATFLIEDISRACSHQLVRHRIASYSQQSQRYVNQDNFDYVIPESVYGLDTYDMYLDFIDAAKTAYATLISLGIPKEDARMLLPNATHTQLLMTCNMREWRHVLKLRCHKSSQWEIRKVMTEILKILHGECPNVFEDLAKEYLK
jgi:thymidylate synthase (FAD)